MKRLMPGLVTLAVMGIVAWAGLRRRPTEMVPRTGHRAARPTRGPDSRALPIRDRGRCCLPRRV